MSLTRKEKGFVFFAMLSAFAICAEYAITRPASNALFLTLFSSKLYPLVWLATVPLNAFVIYLYNWLLPKMGPFRFLSIFAFVTVLINALSAFFCKEIPSILFFQFAWKDIYVLLMLKQLWSMIHSTIPSNSAKYLYGSIYGVGTLGAICGSLVPALLATVLGSEALLGLTAPIYAFFLFFYWMALRKSGVPLSDFSKELTHDPKPKEAFSLIRRTPLLIAILSLVIFMQASVALMEYQFNAHLEIHILEKDLRAAYYGKLMSFVNMASLFFQFLGGLFIIRFLGLKKAHLLVPILLLGSSLLIFVVPSFAMISFAYVFLKGLEFSLFGVMREMLYVPLALDAKFRAKAIIDVFAYRTSKALVALGLIALQVAGTSWLLSLTSYASVALFIGWLLALGYFFRRERNLSLTAPH